MAPADEEAARIYVAQTRHWLAASLDKIKHCLNQLDEEQVWWRPRESMNSIGNILLHLSGNIRQRILSTVGGAPDTRERPKEFAQRTPIPKAELMGRLEKVVEEADAVLVNLGAFELTEDRSYRGLDRMFEGTVLSTIMYSLGHLSGHTQEIVYITRLQLGNDYAFQTEARP